MFFFTTFPGMFFCEIGGIEVTGQPIVVEIDESKFYHSKYHHGQWRQGHWVFCGIERNSGRSFLVEVPDRTVESLRAAIERWILPGSHVVSDGWITCSIRRMDIVCKHR